MLTSRRAITLGAATVLSACASNRPLQDSRTLRTALPVLARHEGVWTGIFRRYDTGGALVEQFDSEITTRFGGSADYEQTNRYVRPGRDDLVIRTLGAFDGERLRFRNERVSGYAIDDAADAFKRSVLLFLAYNDGATYVHESIQISDDGKLRYRATQYFNADGNLQRRTMIDEVRAG